MRRILAMALGLILALAGILWVAGATVTAQKQDQTKTSCCSDCCCCKSDAMPAVKAGAMCCAKHKASNP
jgi:hypothetical protein